MAPIPSSAVTPIADADDNKAKAGIDVGLSDVPETMLWTLHNRANVAADPSKGWFQDAKAIEIYRAIDYDYERSFRKADDSHGIRSWLFDGAVRDFWASHPTGGTVVNFGEGLETQRFRVEDARPEGSAMVSVDLPAAMEARERFIAPDDGNLHVAASVLDFDAWLPRVPRDGPVLFTAQGLLMYLEEDGVRALFETLAREFPGSALWFDSISRWLADLTLRPRGLRLTEDYTAPRMPFGANVNRAPALFRSWVPGLEVEEEPWPLEKADGFFYQYVAPCLRRTPLLKNVQPGMVWKVRFPPSD